MSAAMWTRTLVRELQKHLQRAELSLGDVRATRGELVKAEAAFADLVTCQQMVTELEERVVRYGG